MGDTRKLIGWQGDQEDTESSSQTNTRSGWWPFKVEIRQREPESDIGEKTVRCRWRFLHGVECALFCTLAEDG